MVGLESLNACTTVAQSADGVVQSVVTKCNGGIPTILVWLIQRLQIKCDIWMTGRAERAVKCVQMYKVSVGGLQIDVRFHVMWGSPGLMFLDWNPPSKDGSLICLACNKGTDFHQVFAESWSSNGWWQARGFFPPRGPLFCKISSSVSVISPTFQCLDPCTKDCIVHTFVSESRLHLKLVNSVSLKMSIEELPHKERCHVYHS